MLGHWSYLSGTADLNIVIYNKLVPGLRIPFWANRGKDQVTCCGTERLHAACYHHHLYSRSITFTSVS